jgi:hypothetical protein
MRVPSNVTFDWDEQKNSWLQMSRGVSFEEIVIAIAEGGLVDVLQHPNQERYPGQMIYVVVRDDYCYAVPCVADGHRQVVFLKTAFPSRKLTARYLGQDAEEDDGTKRSY